MTFWEVYDKLCKERNVASATVLTEIGISTSRTTNWKKGVIPNGETLCKLADYFDVSIDYLLGRSKIKKPIDIDELGLTEGDLFIINQLRDLSAEERLSVERDIFAIILSKK
jgi:transcriptional regulator with XRE-family HTH domain